MESLRGLEFRERTPGPRAGTVVRKPVVTQLRAVAARHKHKAKIMGIKI